MTERNTIQRTLVLDAVRALHTHPTAEEIYGEVRSRCPTVSRGTVYRNLSRLASDGEILRVAVANAPDRFDFTARPHCHACCLSCGSVYDYGVPGEIGIDLITDSEFEVTGYELIVKGYCKKCKQKSKS